MSALTLNRNYCPICGKKLEKEIFINNCDGYQIACEQCGEYGMSAIFVEDYLEQPQQEDCKARMAAFLQKYSQKERPFFCYLAAPAPSGYRCIQRWQIPPIDEQK